MGTKTDCFRVDRTLWGFHFNLFIYISNIISVTLSIISATTNSYIFLSLPLFTTSCPPSPYLIVLIFIRYRTQTGAIPSGWSSARPQYINACHPSPRTCHCPAHISSIYNRFPLDPIQCHHLPIFCCISFTNPRFVSNSIRPCPYVL